LGGKISRRVSRWVLRRGPNRIWGNYPFGGGPQKQLWGESRGGEFLPLNPPEKGGGEPPLYQIGGNIGAPYSNSGGGFYPPLLGGAEF